MIESSSQNPTEMLRRGRGEAIEPPSEWWLDRCAAQALFRHLKEISLSSAALEQEIARLGDRHGHGVVCAEVIFLLTRLRLEPDEALRHWPRILAHRARLASRWGHRVDLRVGLMSYFVDVEKHLHQPTVVEMDWIERTRASAYIDEITGLPNHRFFRDQLRREMDRALRDKTPLSLILVDADDFKAVNDGYGHETGNAALASLSRLLREGAQPGHVVARYGGEEFVALLPSTSKADAALLAERLRESVASHRFGVSAGVGSFHLTISLGLATCPADARDDAGLIGAADHALYEAKAAGKNRVVLVGASTRSYARRRAAFGGSVRTVGSAAHPARTVEIGEGGLSFRSACGPAVGTLLEAAIALGPGDDILLAGRVVWTRPLDTGDYETAIRFIEQGDPGRDRLVRWLGADQAEGAASDGRPVPDDTQGGTQVARAPDLASSWSSQPRAIV